MKDKIPKTKREIDFYCDKVLAEQKVFKLRLHIAALNEVLKENRLTPIKNQKK